MNHRAHLHSVYLPKSVSGTPYLWFDSLQGVESINGLFEYKLIVKAKDEHGNPAHGIEGLEGYVSFEAYHGSIIHPKEGTPHQGTTSYQSVASHLDLSSLIGTPLGISLDLNDKHPIDDRTITGQVTRHGIITSCAKLTTHNRHAVYELTLSPWTYLLTKTNNYHIHQHKSIPQIIEEVLSCYPYPWQFELIHDYPEQDYQTQYDESDYAFITRLMSEHGISFYFEHTKDNHTLIITDHVSHLKRHANPFYDTLTLYPPNQRMPEYAEYLEHFNPKSRLTCAQSLLSDYQFKTPNEPLMAHDTIKGVQTDTHKPHQALIHHLQRYEWHQGRRAGGDELATKNEQLIASYRHQSLSATAHGRLKGIQVAHLFTLTGHPHQSMNTDWVVYALQMSIKPIDEDNNTHQYYTADTSFTAYPATHPLVPTTPCPRPIARTQTATVVAPEGEEIHTDQYGRIKVKFHWDKPTLTQRHLVDNRTGDDKDDLSQINTCYLRVASTWAGDHYGHIALPRAGQEVIIDFFGGNPDMPYVAGSLTNPNNMPLYTLPHEKVLSGIRSKEYGGDKSNQLIMDDTKDKLQTHLKSDHLHTEINLGHIRRLTTPQGRGEYRGEGFEVRTDGHGVVRADKGVVITTHGRPHATSHIKDIKETTSQLEQATSTHSSLIQSSIQAQCEERALDNTLMPTLDGLNTSMTGREINDHHAHVNHHDDDLDDTLSHPELSNPHIVLSSLAGMTLTAKQNIHITTDNNLAITTNKDLSLATTSKYNLTVQNGIRVFVQTGGIKHYTAKDDIELQAQQGNIKHIAKDNIEIISTEGKIQITSPTQLSINICGSEFKMNEQGVFITTPGVFRVKSNEKVMEGGEYVGYEVPRLPQSDPKKRQKGFVLIDETTQKALPFREYRILNEDGETFRGVSDRFGFIPQFEDGMLEVVPSMGYYEVLDLREVADLWVDDEINQNNPSELSAVPASSKAKTIPDNQATSSGYIAELRKKDTALAKKIDDMKLQGYALDAVPDVPKGAKLVTIENLIKNTKGASIKQVEYVNWFSTDDSLYPVTETIIKEKHLKAGYFYLFTHANPNIIMYGEERYTRVADIANQLIKDGYKSDKPLVIIACQAGNGVNSIAERLAKHLGVTVYAPTSLAWFKTAVGHHKFSGIYARFKKGKDQIGEPRIKGAFRVFHGAVAKPVQCNPQSNPSKMKIHTVRKGESLATIAKQYGTTINAIAKENNLSDINNLKIGQKLLIPCG